MEGLMEREVGAMFWAGPDPAATLAEVMALGVRCGQLGVPGEMELAGAAGPWREALRQAGFRAVTVIASYSGESYNDIPTVQRTVGFIPHETREFREQRTKDVIDFAAELGIASFGCHVGFVPEEHEHPDYIAVRALVRRIADHAARYGMTFALETGQEPAKVLLEFLDDLERPNVGVNFDPANMILYGAGDPIEALDLLAPRILSVHCKDGDWPPKDQPDALGVEKRLGQGQVGIPAYIQALKRLGFTGPLNIEREAENKETKMRDMAAGVELLKTLRA
jgi:L-ribulose-5-phosphate 3-epimerase